MGCLCKIVAAGMVLPSCCIAFALVASRTGEKLLNKETVWYALHAIGVIWMVWIFGFERFWGPVHVSLLSTS
jgi:energy-converting hydrogenase Eha subunit G